MTPLEPAANPTSSTGHAGPAPDPDAAGLIPDTPAFDRLEDGRRFVLLVALLLRRQGR